MSYSNELKPAKILNLPSLEDLTDRIYLSRGDDTRYFSAKIPKNNVDRSVFYIQTSYINIMPNVRLVDCVRKGIKGGTCRLFVIEPKEKSTGIVVVLMKRNGNTFDCNIRILPLNSLSDIAEAETDSKLLTINPEKSKFVLQMDISIMLSDAGEALYSVNDVDVNAASNLITPDEIVQLKRELEFHGAKIVAHYFQDVMNFFKSGEQIFDLPNDQLKKLLLANTLAGCVSLEIVGSNVIKDLNMDWTAAAAFIGYIL